MPLDSLARDASAPTRAAAPLLAAQAPIDLSRAIPPVPGRLCAAFDDALRRVAAKGTLAALARRNRPGGTARDRALGADWLVRRLGPTDASRVLVSNGTQSLLSVLLHNEVGRGHVLLAEALTYPVLVPLAARFGVHVAPVAIDEDGLIPDAVEEALQRTGAKALFCNPTMHNPTATIMPRVRRDAIVALARRHGFMIIEDDVLGPLHPEAPEPIAALGPDVTWYIQSLSKCASLGLKIAYLSGPTASATAALLASAQNHSFWFPSAVSAEVTVALHESGRIPEIGAAIAQTANARRAIAEAVLKGATYRTAPGALHLWLELDGGEDALEVVRRAADAGVVIRPGKLFCVDPSAEGPRAVRVALTTPETDDTLRKGLSTLAALIARPQ